jgi:thiol-disulfide isomerase/thioredoxin
VLEALPSLAEQTKFEEYPLINWRMNSVFIDETSKEILNNWLEKEKSSEVMGYMAEFVMTYPTQSNLNWFKKNYSGHESFEEFWMSRIDMSFEDFKPSSKAQTYLDHNSEDDQWVILDVWGTWCAPCVEELPDWQKLHEKFEKRKENDIVFLSYTYGSKNLKTFMEKNKYTFSTIEVDNDDIKELNIQYFPTTFIISPRGKAFRIPHTSKKEKVAQVYTLISW